jgi:hypothetical protein
MRSSSGAKALALKAGAQPELAPHVLGSRVLELVPLRVWGLGFWIGTLQVLGFKGSWIGTLQALGSRILGLAPQGFRSKVFKAEAHQSFGFKGWGTTGCVQSYLALGLT